MHRTFIDLGIVFLKYLLFLSVKICIKMAWPRFIVLNDIVHPYCGTFYLLKLKIYYRTSHVTAVLLGKSTYDFPLITTIHCDLFHVRKKHCSSHTLKVILKFHCLFKGYVKTKVNIYNRTPIWSESFFADFECAVLGLKSCEFWKVYIFLVFSLCYSFFYFYLEGELLVAYEIQSWGAPFLNKS